MFFFPPPTNHFCKNFVLFIFFLCFQNFVRPIISIYTVIIKKCVTCANFTFLCTCRGLHSPGCRETLQKMLHIKIHRSHVPLGKEVLHGGKLIADDAGCRVPFYILKPRLRSLLSLYTNLWCSHARRCKNFSSCE